MDFVRPLHIAAVILVGAALSAGQRPSVALAEPGGYQARANQTGDSDPEEAASQIHRNGLESVLGREVRTRVEEDVGRIIDLLADNEGRVQAAVIEFGGFLGIGTRKIAVAWSALRFQSDGGKPQVVVDLTRDQLRVTPEYKQNGPTVVRRASE